MNILVEIFHFLNIYLFLCAVKNEKEYIMKGLIKNSGLILVLIGAIILMVCSFTQNVNDNTILGVATVLIVVGLIVYIVTNKYIHD